MTRGKLSHIEPPMSSVRKAKLAILQWIYEKKLEPGDRLPPQTSLVKSLSCSESTIQGAMRELVQEGIIRRIIGKGSFLVKVPEEVKKFQAATISTGNVEGVKHQLGNIALCAIDLPDQERPAYSPALELLQAAENILYLHADEVRTTVGVCSNVRELQEVIKGRKIDGMIIDWRISPGDPASAEIRRFLYGLEYPIIHCTHEIKLWNGLQRIVTLDNREVMHQGIDYLVRVLGHRHILVASSADEYMAFQLQRLEACEDLRCLYPEMRLDIYRARRHVRGSTFWSHCGEDAFAAWQGMDPRPTAVFAINDEMAAGFLVQAQAAGVKVPQEVSVLGIDNSMHIRAQYRCELSSVDPRRNLIGETAGLELINQLRLLHERQEKNHLPGSILLIRPQLIIRNTTAPLSETVR